MAIFINQQSKKSPTRPTERTPKKPEYLIARSQLRGPLGFGPIQFLMETTTKFHHSQTTGGVAPSYLHTLQGSNSGQKGEILLDFFGPPLGPDEDEDVNYGYVVVPLFSLKPLKILKKQHIIGWILIGVEGHMPLNPK